jgi:hypothetical protein
VFDERHATNQNQVEVDHLKKVPSKEPQTEWQQSVKKKKGDDYYMKLKEVILFVYNWRFFILIKMIF